MPSNVEQLREWYEADPEGETVELPAVDSAIPDCLRRKRNPLKERFVEHLAGQVRNQKARALLEGVIELNHISLGGKRPDIVFAFCFVVFVHLHRQRLMIND